MLKLCENGSNIDYLYETSSVLRKAAETEISGLTFWHRFGFLKTETEPKFGFRTSLEKSKVLRKPREPTGWR